VDVGFSSFTTEGHRRTRLESGASYLHERTA
jgi:hypothetical protein